MKPLPLILVREFGGLDISYRISLRRARNYWEFLEYLHDTFNKPWEQYNSHLHLDDGPCDGRISPSEWEAGGYFEVEFTVNGRLVLYAHFEEVEARMSEPERKEGDSGEAWRWGPHGTGRPKNKWYDSQSIDDDGFDHWDVASYPPFPETLPGETIAGKPITPSMGSNILSSARSPVAEVVTVGDTNTTKYLDTGIIIGRAKPECCHDPNIRPVARAVINSRGALCVYICGDYAKRGFQTELVQIGMEDVEFSEEFANAPSREKRLMAIRNRLKKISAAQHQPDVTSSSPLADLPPKKAAKRGRPSHPTVFEREGIVIGHAKPSSSRDPDNPPLVRATLNSVGAIIASISAAHSMTPHLRGGKARFQLGSVVYTEEFAAMRPWVRSRVIRERIQEQMTNGGSDEHGAEAEEVEGYVGVEEGSEPMNMDEKESLVDVEEKEESLIDSEDEETLVDVESS